MCNPRRRPLGIFEDFQRALVTFGQRENEKERGRTKVRGGAKGTGISFVALSSLPQIFTLHPQQWEQYRLLSNRSLCVQDQFYLQSRLFSTPRALFSFLSRLLPRPTRPLPLPHPHPSILYTSLAFLLRLPPGSIFCFRTLLAELRLLDTRSSWLRKRRRTRRGKIERRRKRERNFRRGQELFNAMREPNDRTGPNHPLLPQYFYLSGLYLSEREREKTQRERAARGNVNTDKRREVILGAPLTR